MLAGGRLDFVDIITDPGTHRRFVALAARTAARWSARSRWRPTSPTAERWYAACREAGVPFFVHENWRWQPPIRALKHALDEGRIGRSFRARITMYSGFPVFDNQPFLRDLEQFILTDMGTHILDVARFLFGEARAGLLPDAAGAPEHQGRGRRDGDDAMGTA